MVWPSDGSPQFPKPYGLGPQLRRPYFETNMAFVRIAMILIGATGILAALAFICSAAYLWTFTSCEGDTECMGTFATFLVFAFVLLPIGVTPVMVGRSLSNPK